LNIAHFKYAVSHEHVAETMEARRWLANEGIVQLLDDPPPFRLRNKSCPVFNLRSNEFRNPAYFP
jgi:hypothetical protein